AVQIAHQSGRDPSTLRSYYDKLRVALGEVNRNPRPIAPGEAAEHFSRGVHAFRGDKLAAARLHFDDAVQLDSQRAVYFYYRALTHLRLGNEDRSRHDALRGADLERQGSHQRAQADAVLAPIQGASRTWLERYRRGSATGRLSPTSR
ncbi:MAG: hypothetical protein N2C14_03615, partial [Planctomycetales bacterium]